MSKTFPGALRIAVLVAAAFAWQGAAAQDVTVVGPVTKIVLAADGQSAVATLKDSKSGGEVQVNVTDELTLDKVKDRPTGVLRRSADRALNLAIASSQVETAERPSNLPA